MKTFLYRISIVHLWRALRRDPLRWTARLLFLLGPWFAFAMVEILNENDLLSDFQHWQVLLNLIWYYILFFLCRLVLGRRRRAGTLAILLCFGVGLVNHYVLRFRGRILFPADLNAALTAANVAGGFDFHIDLHIRQALILLVVYLFLMYTCPTQKRRIPLPRVPALLISLFAVIYSYAFFFTPMLPTLNLFAQQWATQTNGFLLNFTVAARYSIVGPPEGYSQQAAAAVMADYSAVPGDDSIPHPTNLIVIMNEAFGDLTLFETLDTSSDPTPFLHSMQENTVKGWLYPPVTGGGTASTEFEFLTGFSNRFLPPHCVAYQLYIDESTPAFSSLARELGYHATAFHPYHASGWNRPLVYEYLDFDAQLYDTDVVNAKRVRYLISDETDYKVVQELTDARQGDASFIFNVTMQNHSGYAQGWTNLEKSVTVSESLAKADPNADQYFSLMRSSDNALRALITHYEQVEENTLIVFFGDHQPSLTNAFYEALYGKKLNQRTVEEILQQYAVPFFIWANYDIPEQQDVVLSTGFLHVLTAQIAGLPMTGWMQFLSELYTRLPVITPVGFITADGTAVEHAAELPKDAQDLLNKYELLCYNGLMDLSEETFSFFHTLP